MCGIVGYIGSQDATSIILNGLRRLEYRGYDSAGLAILQNGEIEIHVDWDEERILIEVSDNGPGIPEDELPRVFEHLFRGRVTVQDPDHPIDGTGLGLALSKTVIEQHGGRIWVISKEGQGSTFSFTLPWEPTPKTGSLRKEN